MTTDFTLMWMRESSQGGLSLHGAFCVRRQAPRSPSGSAAVLRPTGLHLVDRGRSGIAGRRALQPAQDRAGGKVFIIHKFRSMVEDGENRTPVATREGDRRTTRVGKAMRAYRLDEIPQFWNILKGDMSLVGPRPEQFRLHRRHRAGAAQARVRSVLRQALFLLVRLLHCDQDRRDAFRCAVARRHRIWLEHESSPRKPVSYPLHQTMSSR